MAKSEEKHDPPPPPADEDIERQMKLAEIFMEKHKEALRELAKH